MTDAARLKTGILGLNEMGQDLLDVATQSGHYEVVAVAGRDAEVVQKMSRKYQAQAYEDYRQLLVQNPVDVLFAAGSMQFCDEHLRAALKKQCTVVRTIPPGQTFEQAAQLITLSQKEKARFVVVNPLRFSPAMREMSECVRAQGAEKFHLISAVCNVHHDLADPRDRWMSDPRLAGGGVLLYECYALVDQILRSFGLPQQVYCLTTNRAPDRQQRLSITEDTAVVTLRFSDTLLGTVTTSRTFGPWLTRLRMHSDEGYLVVTDDSFTVYDNDGKVLEQKTFCPDYRQYLGELLENVAMNIRDPQKNKLFAGPDDDLHTMAVIEAAYLSARTAVPEEPGRILNLARMEPTNLLP